MTDELRVRPAAEDDAELLLAWRNDPEARRWSRSSEAIDLPTHRAWLLRTLASPDRHLLVLEQADGTPVATTRYDRLEADAAAWEVSISVGPDVRGRGLGGATLRASDRWLLDAEPAAERIVAHVRPENDASRRLFERNGYAGVPSGEPGMLRFERRRGTGAPGVR
jgi:RimJ/RimL family protein N-acetyltransferase